MKLTTLFFFIALFEVSAHSSYAQQTRMTLKFENATLEKVFSKIEENSEFSIFYKNELIRDSKEINGEFKDALIFEVLDDVLKSENLSYTVDGKLIIIIPENGTVPEMGGQQKRSISGKVTDQSGGTLPGVSVVLKGTAMGVITDIDGKFTLSNVPDNGVLQFSFVGMKSQEIAAAGKTTINVSLEEETIGLEEVIAIGYGTVKKTDLTGAVGSVKGDLISERQTTQLSQALQGATSGVMVTRSNNAPGATASIRIRGVTTIGDSNPLIIVDGVPVDNINDINPNDVQDMSVLKDAASASIYGSRAASGVILITTKRAKTGEVALTYNAEYGVEKPTAQPDYVSVQRYMKMVNELRWNDNGNNANEYPTYAKDIIDNYATLNAENPNKYPDTDWTGMILNSSAPRQSHVLSITAGTKVVRTKASLGYDKTDGLFDGKSYERITARFNNDITINKFLSASIDLNFKRTIAKNPNIDPIYNMRISAPVYAALWSDGRVAEGKTGANIYGMSKFGGYTNSWYNQVGGKMSLDFTPLEGLKISAIISPTLGFDKSKNFQQRVPYYAADDPTVFLGTLEYCNATNLYENRNDYSRVTSQFLANYVESFGEHNLNVMAGYENYHAFNENLGASRQKYELTAFPYLDLGPLDLRGNNGSAWENAYRSYFGRVLYNFRNKYFLQGNIRYDGSSRFHEDYRWGAFPSFSGGWVISEESFMKSLKALSYLKLRASWGTLGNERIGNYPYQATIAFSNALFFQSANAVAAQTAAQTQYAIQDISWETTESVDLGIDANFFENRLRFTGDYYEKTTKDMLLALQIPVFMGFDNPNQNTGKMYTKGWDADISWSDKIGEVGYSVSANISDFKSEMGDLGGTEFIGDQVKKKGSEFNEWYGYVSQGLFQTADDLAASPKLNTAIKVGDVKYKDISGPGGIPDGKITPDYDRVLLGGSLPRYIYGSTVKLDYKNFDFSMVFQGVGKINTRLSSLMVEPLVANWGHVPAVLDGTTWSKYNTDAQNLEAKYPRLSQNNKGANYSMSDYWLINGGYLRLKNITVGYSLPAAWTKKCNIQRVRIYASASDILTMNNYPKGWDPEVSESGYPITASFVGGLSVTF